MRKFIITLFLVFLAQPSFALEEFITQSAKDYQLYIKSNYANPVWDPFVEEGFEAFDKENLEVAIEFLRKAYLKGCRSPLVLFKLGLSFEAIESYYSAVQYYELAGHEFQKNHRRHRYAKHFEESYGRALYLLGAEAKAIEVLEKAATKTDASWVLRLMGRVSIERKKYLEAVAYYERLLQAKDSDVTIEERLEINRLLARIFRNKGQENAAKRYYNRILEVNPHDPEAVGYVHQYEPKVYDDSKLVEILNKLGQ